MFVEVMDEMAPTSAVPGNDRQILSFRSSRQFERVKGSLLSMTGLRYPLEQLPQMAQTTPCTRKVDLEVWMIYARLYTVDDALGEQ